MFLKTNIERAVDEDEIEPKPKLEVRAIKPCNSILKTVQINPVKKLSIALTLLFFDLPLVFAQQADQAMPELTFGQRMLQMLPMIGMIFFIFYFLVLVPQRKQLQAHNKLVADLKKGESVITSSGIIGRVAGVEKDHILLEVANNVRIKLERSSVTKRYEVTTESE